MRPTRSCEIRIDGASRGNPGPAGSGGVCLDGAAKPVRRFSKYLGEWTNNVAEYAALVYALQEALLAGYTRVTVKTDSELLARQISGTYKVRDHHLRLFHGLALHLLKGFARCTVEHIPRTQNALADRLAAQGVQHRTVEGS